MIIPKQLRCEKIYWHCPNSCRESSSLWFNTGSKITMSCPHTQPLWTRDRVQVFDSHRHLPAVNTLSKTCWMNEHSCATSDTLRLTSPEQSQLASILKTDKLAGFYFYWMLPILYLIIYRYSFFIVPFISSHSSAILSHENKKKKHNWNKINL